MIASKAAVDDETLIRVRGLHMDYPIRGRGVFGRTNGWVHAVNGVDLSIRSGEVLGLVGESGCGKTTLGRCIVGDERATSGHVYYQESPDKVTDLVSASKEELRRHQRDIRVIFQDPFSSLNPRMTVAQIVGDPLASRRLARGSELEDRVAGALRRVGLSPSYMRRFPHAFSGGERQRINIARALILDPRFVIADEAVSALDVSVRAQIINLLRDLQDELSLTYLFISHDLSVVESICDRVAVMYLGRVVELADTEEIYNNPQHPYTEALLSAVPRPDPRLRGVGRQIRLSDEFPDPSNPPDGCFFHTRCPYADGKRCSSDPTALREIGPQHWADCHYSETLELAGVGSDLDAASR